MKKQLRFLMMLSVAAFFSSGLQAQISIDNTEYPFQYGEDPYSIDKDVSGIKLPQAGENMTYDYSDLTADEEVVAKSYDGTTNASFPNAKIMERTIYSLQGFDYRVSLYFALDDKRFARVGRTQHDTTHSLLMVTGGANDEINISEYDCVFPQERTYLKFPLNYNDEVDESIKEITKFNITVAAFGLNKTPGEIVRHRHQTRKVIGYGKVIIPDENGNPCNPINVLLVKVNHVVVDSVFLGGAPAPKALLDAFGFAQGRTLTDAALVFETENFGRQVASFNFNTSNNLESVIFRPEAARLTVSSIQPNVQASIYPSLLKSGDRINFSIKGGQTLKAVALYDAAGNSINLNINASNACRLPISLSPGIYFYRAEFGNGAAVSTGKVLISE